MLQCHKLYFQILALPEKQIQSVQLENNFRKLKRGETLSSDTSLSLLEPRWQTAASENSHQRWEGDDAWSFLGAKTQPKYLNWAASDSVASVGGQLGPPSVTSALTLRLCRMSDVSPKHPIRSKHRCPGFHFHLEHLVDPFLPPARCTSAHFCPRPTLIQ